MTFKGVFFDLYGTLLIYGDLVAGWADWLSALHESLQGHGQIVDPTLLATHCDGFFGKAAPPDRGDGLTVYERRIEALCHELGISAARSRVHRAATATIEAWEKHISLDPDAVSVLKALSPHKTLALVSNYDHPPHIRALLAQRGLAPYFQAVVVSGDVAVAKPDPRIFALAVRQTGLRPHEVVYVGDTSEDVQGARAAGLVPVRIRRAGLPDEHLASDFHTSESAAKMRVVDEVEVIHTLPELLEIV